MGTCTLRLCHINHGQAMKKTNLFKVLLTAGGLLCTAVPWGDPVPSGAMAEYLVHCDGWSLTKSAASCAGFLDRLAAVEHPSPDERLALLLSRKGISHGEGCAGLQTIADDHPDYAEVLYYLGLYGCGSEAENVALMRRALEIEPDNYRVLSWLLLSVEGHPPEAPDLPRTVSDIDPGSLAAYREALYEAGLARAFWWQEVMKDAEPDDPPAEDLVQGTIWDGPLTAGRSIYAAAVREGDHRAARAIRARLRRDLELDALDYGRENAWASLALACDPALYGPLDMDDLCLSGIEKLAGQASTDGLPLPSYVLKAIELTTDDLRRQACAESTGQSPYGRMALLDKCLGPGNVTETAAVARLRAVLEYYDGPRSSEHHRVHAQGFLGDDARLDGLRTALRTDPENAQARCDLARALSPDDPEAAAAVLGEGDDTSCLEYSQHVWGDRPGR